jgi:hypothetical protein
LHGIEAEAAEPVVFGRGYVLCPAGSVEVVAGEADEVCQRLEHDEERTRIEPVPDQVDRMSVHGVVEEGLGCEEGRRWRPHICEAQVVAAVAAGQARYDVESTAE